MVDEKTPFQKIATDWIFNQSVGIIISLFTIGMCLYFISQLQKEMAIVRQDYKELILYQRDVMKTTLDDNTKALENFKSFSNGRYAPK